jgi:hypothetical protein
MIELSDANKQEVALMILLWKEFKTDGKLNLEVAICASKFADLFGVHDQFLDLLAKVPPLKIVQRYP